MSSSPGSTETLVAGLDSEIPAAPIAEEFRDGSAFARARREWQVKEVKILQSMIGVLALLLIVAIVADYFRAKVIQEVVYVIRVDNTTGAVDMPVRLQNGPIELTEAVTSAYIRRYVQARESYTRFTYNEHGYKVCALFTPADDIQKELLPIFDSSKPTSLYRRYGENGKVEVLIRYVIPTRDKYVYEAHVTMRETTGDSEPLETHWIIVLHIKADRSLVAPEALKDNPFGFLVIGYRKTPEDLK